MRTQEQDNVRLPGLLPTIRKQYTQKLKKKLWKTKMCQRLSPKRRWNKGNRTREAWQNKNTWSFRPATSMLGKRDAQQSPASNDTRKSHTNRKKVSVTTVHTKLHRGNEFSCPHLTKRIPKAKHNCYTVLAKVLCHIKKKKKKSCISIVIFSSLPNIFLQCGGSILRAGIYVYNALYRCHQK